MRKEDLEAITKRLDIFNDKQFKGLFSVYTHFFNILEKDEQKIARLLNEIQAEIASTSCTELMLTNADTLYAILLVHDILKKQKLEETKTYIHLFAMLKWVYKNNRKVLEDSRLYKELSKSSRNSVVIESEIYTHEKIRLILKSIDTEPKFIESMLEKVKLLPSYRNVIISLWGILRNIKGDEQKRQIGKLFKSEEMCCIIQTIFDKFCSVDIFNDFHMSIDQEGVINTIITLLEGITEDLSKYVTDLEVEIKPATEYSHKQLTTINKDLKSRYKAIRILKHQESKANIQLEIELEAEVNEKIYKVDFGLSIQEKKDLLATSRFLLLKSDDITIVPIMNNVRAESIYSVSSETLKSDYDAIIVLTKNVAHSDVFRIKASIGNTPLIYTSRTNRRLIIEDIYNQF